MVRNALYTLAALSLSLFVVSCSTGEDEVSPTPTTACSSYCTDMAATCTGDNAQYADDAACQSACAGFATTGTDGDASGDTLQCRVYHLGVAGTDAESATTHCPHAAADGGGVCVNP